MNRANRNASTSRERSRGNELPRRKYKNSQQNDEIPIQYSANKSEDKYRRNRWNSRSLSSSSSSSRSSLSTHRSLSHKRKMSPSRLSDRRSLRRSTDRMNRRSSSSRSRPTSQSSRRRSPSEKSPSAHDSRTTNKSRVIPHRHRRPNALTLDHHERNVARQEKIKSRALGQKRNRQSTEKTSSMGESTSSESSHSPGSTSGSNSRTVARSSKKGVSRKNDQKYTKVYRSEKTSSSSIETHIKSEHGIKSEVFVKSEVYVKSEESPLCKYTQTAAVRNKQVAGSSSEDNNVKNGPPEAVRTKPLAKPVTIKTEQDKTPHKKTTKTKSAVSSSWAKHRPFQIDLMAELNKPYTMKLSDRFGRLAKIGPRIPSRHATLFNNCEAGSRSSPYKEWTATNTIFKGPYTVNENQRRLNNLIYTDYTKWEEYWKNEMDIPHLDE